jgi:hypothetical protein
MEISQSSEEEELHIRKLQLEIDKLKLENTELGRKWYKKPQWYSIFIPFIIGLVTIIIAYLTGFLNTQSLVNKNENIKNQNESILLKIEIDKFEKLKENLFFENQKLNLTRDSLKESIQLLVTRNNTMSNILETTLSKSKTDNEKINSLIKEIEKVERKLYDSIKVIQFNNLMTLTGQAKLFDINTRRYEGVEELLKVCQEENKLLKTKIGN